MRGSVRLPFRLAIATAVVVGLWSSVGAAQRSAQPPAGVSGAARTPAAPAGAPPELFAAQDVLFLAYPELAGRSMTLTFSAVNGTIAVTASDAVNPLLEKPQARHQRIEPLVAAAMAFTPTGELRSLTADGVLLESGRNQALHRTLLAHPQWNEADAEDWLLKAGGRMGTTRPFPAAGAVADAGWQRFLGTNRASRASAFRWREDDGPGSGAKPLRAKPTWVLDIGAGDGTGYRLEFEPFGGRLVAVTRR